MFGVLKHAGCAMPPEERQEWTGHVCGVCLVLRNDYGQFSRLTTNYDAALLSALYEAQREQPQRGQTSYCPLRSSFKTAVVAADNPGVRYAASMSLMMAASRIKDHIQDDEKGLRYIQGIATGIADRWMRTAGETAVTLGFAAQCIEQQVHRQAEVEAQTEGNFFQYSDPTECAVGAAFAHTAVLANRPENKAPLHNMGRMFGRIIYLLDSFEDYKEDTEAQRFNALATAFSETAWRSQAINIFRQAYAELKKDFQHLELPRPALLQTLLLQKLQQKGKRSLRICPEMSTNDRPPTTGLFQLTTSFPFIRLCQQNTYVHEKKKTPLQKELVL
ncbi:MAG: hypothetical protein D3925_11035 [Candidatus Electrothrix sp. AR5]|nr:hypothetical protein [Candidatus Electrothrix sp. AR5]